MIQADHARNPTHNNHVPSVIYFMYDLAKNVHTTEGDGYEQSGVTLSTTTDRTITTGRDPQHSGHAVGFQSPKYPTNAAKRI